ncbi:MAG: hypothetical protein FJX57_15530 [Alphaproteobacteria bacterium]|nr:hypothetical protein [Alphaproteobacteria bacterium]
MGVFSKSRRCGAILALLIAAAPTTALAQFPPIDGGGYWTWTNIDQGTCMNRAIAAMQAAVGHFQIPAGLAYPAGWVVGLTNLPDTHAGIHCIADDDTHNLVSPSAKRVLIVITMHTTRGFGSKVFRDFVGECMQTGKCPQSVTAPIVGKWEHRDGFGNIEIWAEGNRFKGKYTAKCPGATQQGQFDLERFDTPEGVRYRGTWGDDVCNGRIENLRVNEKGEAWYTGVWLKGGAGNMLAGWRRP